MKVMFLVNENLYSYLSDMSLVAFKSDESVKMCYPCTPSFRFLGAFIVVYCLELCMAVILNF